MSISGEDHNVKLWNISNQKCLHDIKNVNKLGILYSACLLYENNQYYVITSDFEYNGNPEPIKIFDLNGNKLKEIKDSQNDVSFLDTYHDKKSSKIYIIAGTSGQIKSYDYTENKLYKSYKDKENNFDHKSIIIDDRDDVVKMIESSEDGKVRIWNFISGDLLSTINVSDKALYGLCLWNKDYLFVGSEDKSLKLVDLKIGKVTKELTGHSNDVITVLKVTHPQLGECLVSQGWVYDQIKLWIIKN
jgi:WD40 repeat protein